MKKLILFNHKGGVSKTTSTFHIGWMIAKKGHRVLLVDADPQCNLTSVFLGEKFDEYYENPLTRSNNIKDGVSPAFDGMGRLIEGFECPVAMQRRLRTATIRPLFGKTRGAKCLH